MTTAATLIVEARKRAGITQAELARRMGTHQPVIARWESGGTRPDLATVQRAVRAAGFELTLALTIADDHDVTLIRRQLGLAPHQRLSTMVSAVQALSGMAAVARG